MEPYNPKIKTFEDRPSMEATKATSFINRYMYWITNQSNEERFNNAFGTVMGQHFWNKLMELRETRGSLTGDLSLWLEMTNTYRDQLMHYIIKTGYKCQ